MKVLLAVLGLAVSGVSGYYSGMAAIGERVRALEVRQEVQYQALIARIDDVGERSHQGHLDIRADLNGIRAELMNILRQKRDR